MHLLCQVKSLASAIFFANFVGNSHLGNVTDRGCLSRSTCDSRTSEKFSNSLPMQLLRPRQPRSGEESACFLCVLL